MELFVYYILPNIVLFGGIFILAKVIERSTWYVIENYDSLVDKLLNS